MQFTSIQPIIMYPLHVGLRLSITRWPMSLKAALLYAHIGRGSMSK